MGACGNRNGKDGGGCGEQEEGQYALGMGAGGQERNMRRIEGLVFFKSCWHCTLWTYPAVTGHVSKRDTEALS